MRFARFTVAFVGASCPVALFAQEAAGTTRQRLCQEFAATVSSGAASDSAKVEATERLVTCEVSGPTVVSRLWAAAPNDSASLERLVYLAELLRDRRILDSVGFVARASTRPDLVRLAAFRVLVSYFDPVKSVTFAHLRAADPSTSIPTATSLDPHVGAIPLPSTVKSSVATILRDLAASDPSPVVRAAALFLRQGTYYLAPQVTPLDANSIRLTYLCGNRFRLRNHNNIAIDVSYGVYGTAERRTIGLRSRPPGQAYSETTFTTKIMGTVRVFHVQQLVQSKENGGSGCGEEDARDH